MPGRLLIITLYLPFLWNAAMAGMPSDERHLLRLNLRKYESYSYDCDAEMTTVAKYRGSNDEVQPSNMAMSMTITMRVKDVVMGQSSIDCSVTELKVQGREAPSFTMKIVVDPMGRVLSSNAPSSDPIARLIVSTITPTELIGVPFPADPIGIGASWSTRKDDTITVDGATGAVYTQGTLTNTLASVKDTLGVQCWVVESQTKNVKQHGEITAEEIDLLVDGTGSQRGRSIIDAATGMLLHQEQSMSLVSTTRPVSDELATMATIDITTTLKIVMQRKAIR